MHRSPKILVNFIDQIIYTWCWLNYNIFHRLLLFPLCIGNHMFILTYMNRTGK
jgi:hypothetical protein